ncbi:hypothetical protein ACLB1Q_33175 [Escherichia coli]
MNFTNLSIAIGCGWRPEDPPFDVRGVTVLLYGSEYQRYHIEATRRTLNAMVNDGILYRVKVREPRFDVRIGSDGAHCTVIRYGLGKSDD